MSDAKRENRMLLAPMVLFLLIMLGFPAVLDVIYSFTDVSFRNLLSPSANGIANYKEVIRDPEFWQAVWFSLRFGMLTAFLETVLGLFLAVFLAPIIQRHFWLMAFLMMPMIIAPSLMGLMYRLVLHEFVGPLPYYLYKYFGESIAFLGPQWVFTTLIVIEVLQWTPFCILLFYTAYQAIPEDVREAARVDGTRGWRMFRMIEFPYLVPTLVIALGIRFIDGFRVFDNIYVLTGAGAGGSTTSLSIYIYSAFFKSEEIGKALAASVILFIAAFAVLFFIGRMIAKRRAA